MSAAAPASPAALRCPRCGADVLPEQDWCLECGAPARTRLAPTPNWRVPLAIIAAVVLVGCIVIAVAFSTLTRDDGTVTTPAAPAGAAPPAPAAETATGAASPAPAP